jgi:hypothetical protein
MSNIGDDVDASVFDGTPMVQTQCNSASELMESGYQSGTVGEEVAALSLSVEELVRFVIRLTRSTATALST